MVQTVPPTFANRTPPIASATGTLVVAEDAVPLTLAGATKAALAANPISLAAQQQLAIALARLGQAQAGTRYAFSLTSSAGVSNATVIQPPPSAETFYTIVNAVTLPLPIGRKPRLAVAQANAQLAAARAQYAGALLTLSGQVSAAYYDVLRKQALLAVTEDTLVTAKRQLADARKRFQAGDVPELDVERATVPVATAEAGVDQAETAVTVARETLNALLGRPLDTPTSAVEIDEAKITANPVLALSVEQVRRRAIEMSPDARAAAAGLSAAEEGLRLAGTSRDATYALQASDSHGNDETSFSRLDSIQATVTIPLSDGGLASAQKDEAKAALVAAKAQAEAARRTAEAAASAAFRNAQSGTRMIAAAKTARDIAQSTYEKTALGYREGLYPLSDVLTAQSASTLARIAYTQAVYDAATALAALGTALGELPQ